PGYSEGYGLSEDDHTLLPDPRLMQHLQPDFASFNWSGYWEERPYANRFSDPNFITTGTIKSITYPTGGRTEFEFEPHTFHNQRMFSATEQAVFVPEQFGVSVSDMNDP